MFSRISLRPIMRSLKLAPRQITTSSIRSLSKSDSELLNYLDDQLEQEKARNIGAISSWGPIKVEGAIGSMEKKHGEEKISVRFNLNGAMPSLEEQDQMEEAGEEPLCLPDFEVIIEKDGKKKIWINCIYDVEEPEEAPTADDEETDAFEIISLTIASDETDFPYVMNMDAMDPAFYDQIFNFLEDRGITEKFVEEMSTTSTDVENNLYRETLEALKSFIK